MPAGVLGLGFVGDRIHAMRVAQGGARWHVTHVATEQLSFMPFRAAPQASDAAALTHALRRIATAIPQGHWPLQITLPDPVGVFDVLAFDTLPTSARERAALARFRLEKDWPVVAHRDCITQDMGKTGARSLLLAMAVDRSWRDLVCTACRDVGFVPTAMDLNINYVFNRFHDRFAQSKHDGVLIVIEADYWAVLLFDNTPRPRFFRTRWREPLSNPASDHGVIVMEVERLIRAYVLAEPGRKIEEMYVYADDTERSAFAAQLDARLSAPAQQLDSSEGFLLAAGMTMDSLVPGLFAAGIPRR